MLHNKNPQTGPTKVRANPRISINKLGEYLATRSASRRRTILHEQKYERTGIVGQYNQAKSAIKRFLADPEHNAETLHRAISKIELDPTLNPQQKTRKNNNVAAIMKLLSFWPQSALKELTIRAAHPNSNYLTIGDVPVSVSPELEIVAPQRGSGTKYGLLKLYLGKIHPLNEESGQLIATTVHQFAEKHFGTPENVDRKRCYVLDVFQGKLFIAPASYTKRRSDIEAACEEIAARWPTL